MTNRGRLPLVLLLVLGGCFGGGKAQPADQSWMKSLQGLKVVAPTEHYASDGKLLFSIGDLEAALPAGWQRLTIAGQTKYIAPGGGETLQIFGYTSEDPLDDARKHDVAVGLNSMSEQGEHLLSRFAKVDLSTPSGGRTPWGADMRFSAVGPLNRMSFHYSTVAAHEAVMVQLDGNSMLDTPAHAVALIKSFHYKGGAPAPAPSVAPPIK